jgi:hypothetical protein
VSEARRKRVETASEPSRNRVGINRVGTASGRCWPQNGPPYMLIGGLCYVGIWWCSRGSGPGSLMECPIRFLRPPKHLQLLMGRLCCGHYLPRLTPPHAQVVYRFTKHYRGPFWGQHVPDAVPTQFRLGSDSVPTRFRLGSDSVPTRFRLGSDAVPTRFRRVSDSVPTRSRLGSDSVPTRFRRGSVGAASEPRRNLYCNQIGKCNGTA